MQKLPKAVRDAMKTALSAGVHIPRDGNLLPVLPLNSYEIQCSLLNAYYAGMRAGVSALVKATVWLPAVSTVRAEIRKQEKESRG